MGIEFFKRKNKVTEQKAETSNKARNIVAAGIAAAAALEAGGTALHHHVKHEKLLDKQNMAADNAEWAAGSIPLKGSREKQDPILLRNIEEMADTVLPHLRDTDDEQPTESLITS